MAEPLRIEEAERVVDLYLNGTVVRGDMLAYDGSTGWVQAACTDAATNLYAQYVALSDGVAGDTIEGCKGCTIEDADAPYTAASATEYLSTAGAITQVRPTTNGDVIQVVGRSISTSRVRIDIEKPKEVEVWMPHTGWNLMNSGAVEALAQDGTTTAWIGPDVDTAQVAGIFAGWFPSGMVGAPLAADILVNTQASTALDVDITGVRAYINATNVGDAGAPITAGSTTETTADNEVQKVSALTLMDANFAKAGAPFSIIVDPDAGDFLLIGLLLRFLVV